MIFIVYVYHMKESDLQMTNALHIRYYSETCWYLQSSFKHIIE